MLEFVTSSNKISFTVDGKPFVIDGLTVADIPKIGELEKLDDSTQAFLDFMQAGMNQSTRAAFQKLSIPAMKQLLKEWTDGAPLGESSGSAE